MTILLLLCVFLYGTHASLKDDHMGYQDMESYNHHPCKRSCVDDEGPLMCEYDFLVEHYHTLAKACYDCPFTQADCHRPHCVPTDGTSRGIITVNRMMPGPGIHVCEGDMIRVRVHNKLEMNEGVTIHWHGVHQRGSPYMDGTNMVTQCPIPAQTSFTYTFTASTPGTHMWHAHSGFQVADGLFGNLVIRQSPSKEVHISRYDLDLPQHTMLVNHWIAADSPPTFLFHPPTNPVYPPIKVLVNGKGMAHEFQDPKTGLNVTTPREVFTVRKGYKYRMRAVSSGIFNCPIRISFDSHMITVIASDGSPVEPMEVESVTIHDGERYDFVLDANQKISNYLVRYHGLGDCGELYYDAVQTAILKYEGAPENPNLNTPAPRLVGKELNPLNTMLSPTKIPVTELKSLLADDPAVTRQPDKKIVVGMDFHIVNNPRFHNLEYYPIEKVSNPFHHIYTAQMNNITSRLPPSPPLTQYHNIPQDMFCNKETLSEKKDCGTEFCECIHLYKVALGDVVEVTLVDEGQVWDSNHPTHLHGHQFRVIAMGKLGNATWTSNVEELDKAGGITRKFDRPAVKDTVTVPDGGYTVIRFHATNPGFWSFHCHQVFHAEIGMGILFQVGDIWELPRRPARFPQCGSWDAYDPDTEEGKEEAKEESDEEKRDFQERIERLEIILSQTADNGGGNEGHRVHVQILTLVLCSALSSLYIL